MNPILLFAIMALTSDIQVIDGDTIKVQGKYKVRLAHIDAPEKKQPHGVESTLALRQLISESYPKVVVDLGKKDYYGRYLGTVTKLGGGHSINEDMVSTGYAWAYKNDKTFASAQDRALISGLGIWADGVPQAPWDYRRWVKRKLKLSKPKWVDKWPGCASELPSYTIQSTGPSQSNMVWMRYE